MSNLFLHSDYPPFVFKNRHDEWVVAWWGGGRYAQMTASTPGAVDKLTELVCDQDDDETLEDLRDGFAYTEYTQNVIQFCQECPGLFLETGRYESFYIGQLDYVLEYEDFMSRSTKHTEHPDERQLDARTAEYENAYWMRINDYDDREYYGPYESEAEVYHAIEENLALDLEAED